MTTNRKPATALPLTTITEIPFPVLRVNAAAHRGDYSIDNEDSSVEFGRISSRTVAHEIVRRANAYPRLVAALQAVAGSHVSQYGKDKGICYVRPETAALVRTLLRDLGES